MRLHPDRSAEQVQRALDQALQGLRNLGGAGTAVDTYVKCVALCEQTFRGVFLEPDLVSEIYSQRFWHLLNSPEEGPASLGPRWTMVLYAEMDAMLRRLEEVEEQYRQLMTIVRRPGKVLVYDTNSLMHFEPPQAIRWADLAPGQLRLVVPLVVVDELDRKRYSGSPKMSIRARAAQRALHEVLGTATPGAAVPVPKRPHVTLEVLLDERGHRRVDPDDEIIERALLLRQLTGEPVTVITRDVGMTLRAEAAGLQVLGLPTSTAKPDDGEAGQ